MNIEVVDEPVMFVVTARAGLASSDNDVREINNFFIDIAYFT